jgi:hypothetical protein
LTLTELELGHNAVSVSTDDAGIIHRHDRREHVSKGADHTRAADDRILPQKSQKKHKKITKMALAVSLFYNYLPFSDPSAEKSKFLALIASLESRENASFSREKNGLFDGPPAQGSANATAWPYCRFDMVRHILTR